MAFAASRLADRYQLGRPLGTGGLGDVVAGRDVLLDRPVAVKVLHPEVVGDPVFMARFAREVKAAARVSHPNLVAVYDIGEDRGMRFVVTELVEGRTLAELLRDGDDLPAEEPARLIGQVCSALAAAHAKGLVHCDLRPDNIMVTAQGRVKVTDFGVGAARKAARPAEAASDLRTALYASPEEAKGLPLDTRSDLYSLGVCLYECLAGEPPFTGSDPAAVAAAHARRPPPLRAERPDLPASVDAVMARALAKDPGNRYQSAADLREDLELALAGRPLRHAAVPAAERAGQRSDAVHGRPPEPAERDHEAVEERAGRRAPAAPSAPPTPPTPTAPRPTTKVTTLLPLVPQVPLVPAMAATAASFSAGNGPRALTMSIPAPDSVIEVGGVEDVSPSRRGRTATLVLALPLLLVLLVGLALDQARIGPFADPEAPSTAAGLTVPMLVGTPADEARAALEGLGLNVQEVRRAHGVVPAGLVITTEPGPGSPVGPGQTVRLVVSSGPTQAPVPSVVDKPGPAAEAALVEAGFPCEVRQVPSDRPAGTVLAQEPPAGRRLPPGHKVVLTVAAPKPGTGGGGTGGGSPGTTTPGAGGGVPATTVGGDGDGRDPGGGGRDPDGGPGSGTTSPPDTDPPATVPPTTLPETTVPPVTQATVPPTTADPNGRGDTVLDGIQVTLPEISIRRIL